MHLSPKRESRAALALGVLLSLGATPAAAQSTEVHADPWPFDWPRACLSSTEEVAVSIESCMRSVMYPHQVGDEGEPEVDAAAAALVCRGARTGEASRSLASCVKRLLYERAGLGKRRPGVEPGDAALACQHATSQVAAGNVEDCMRRLLYERSGLGERREDMSSRAAASICQGTVAPPVRAYPSPYLVPGCLPPSGSEATRLVEECVRRLMYRRGGLGERRRAVAAELAVYACKGALDASP
ncbi:MAG TPA: hypothetical protein VLQ93_15425 [Myxococcaceae bacterium]|nr:hypothetical protein [Myxococcaceae bacterium]